MIRRMLGVLSLSMGLFVVGCRPTPLLQGAKLSTPPATSVAARPTNVPQTTASQPALKPSDVVPSGESPRAALALESSAFDPGDVIPARYSCDGENISPQLAWGPPPEGTASYALITDDPDAPGGTWRHWVIYNIPPDANGLIEDVPAQAELPDGSRQGTNSGRRLGYAGPCPPGGTHRYFFKLFALDQELDLPSGVTADELTAAMVGHVRGQAELMGTYTRD